MVALLVLFGRTFLLLHLAAVFMGVALVLVFERFGVPWKHMVAMVCVIGNLGATLSMILHVPQNLSWVLALPLSKRQVLFLSYAMNVLLVPLTLASTLTFVALASWIKTGKVELFTSALELVSAARENEAPLTLGLYPLMALVVSLSIAHSGFLGAIAAKAAAAGSRHSHVAWDRARVRRLGMKLGGVGLGVWIFREYVDTPIVYFTAVMAFCWLGLTGVAMKAVAMPRPHARRWLGAAAAVATVLVGLVYSSALSGLRSGQTPRMAEAVRFLGPFSARVSEPELARLLHEDLKSADLEKIGELYQSRHSGGELIPAAGGRKLRFIETVASKTTVEAVLIAVRLFDPRALTLGDLTVLYRHLGELGSEDIGPLVSELLPAKLSVADTLALIGSDDELAILHGLLRARYHRDPAYVGAIEASRDRYRDVRKLQALVTLSILRGERLRLDHLFNPTVDSASRRPASSYFEIDCRKWKPRPVNELTPADEPALNVCLRERARGADPALQRRIETLAWIGLPFGFEEKRLLRQLAPLSE